MGNLSVRITALRNGNAAPIAMGAPIMRLSKSTDDAPRGACQVRDAPGVYDA
jgi:hypothetical protein